jgi:elongation factor G
MKVYQTNEIKNLALLGGAKTGKTTLAEAMLFEGGVINRRGSVDDKNTVSDYREIELERQNSISSTVLYAEFADKKINFIDAPGFDDFTGEVIAALKVVDTAVLVINAQNGVEVGTEISWRYTSKNNKPVIFAINHLEHENSNFEETVRQLKVQFGKSCTICQYPVNQGLGFNSIVDLIQMKMFNFKDDGKAEIVEIPDSEIEKAKELQSVMIEDLAAVDEALMEKFFDAGTLEEKEMQQGLKLGITSRSLFPILCVNAKKNMGVARFMQFITNNVPSPNEVAPPKTLEGKEIPCNAANAPSVFIFKTGIEPHLGEVSYFKVVSGQISEGFDMVNTKNGSKERISQIMITAGKNREKVEKIVAGDIGATIKLKNSHTNTSLTTAKNTNDLELH